MIWRPSVTVAAVMERDGRFLLVEEEDGERLVYNQPAGHWEQGETLTEACVREVLEETAHRFEPAALVGIYRWRPPASEVTYLRFAFCGKTGDVELERPLDEGIRRALWLTLAEIKALSPRHRSPLVLRCVQDYLDGRRYPLDLIAYDG